MLRDHSRALMSFIFLSFSCLALPVFFLFHDQRFLLVIRSERSAARSARVTRATVSREKGACYCFALRLGRMCRGMSRILPLLCLFYFSFS